MSDPLRQDEEFVEDLLGILKDDVASPPPELEARTQQRVRASLTTRDLIDLTTVVFLLRFCAPLMDLIAAMFGVDVTTDNRRDEDE
jgi:hypothetical protein